MKWETRNFQIVVAAWSPFVIVWLNERTACSCKGQYIIPTGHKFSWPPRIVLKVLDAYRYMEAVAPGGVEVGMPFREYKALGAAHKRVGDSVASKSKRAI